MFQRVLGTSLIQALRACALLLIPFWLIALIAWATAGSISGTTSDPIRAATWIWLASHHVPFSLNTAGVPGLLSYLPIGALALTFFAIRNGLRRTFESLHGQYRTVGSVRLIYATVYAAYVTIVAALVGTDSVEPIWYIALPTTLISALLASSTVGGRIRLSPQLMTALRTMAGLLGISALFFALSLALNFTSARNISTLLEPGFFGGILLTLLNIAYLPNAAISAMSYLSGAGFALGQGTLIAPYVNRVGDIPALPLLAATPSGLHLWTLATITLFITAGVVLVRYSSDIQSLIQSYILCLLSILTMSYLGSGALITDAMGAVGTSVWKMTLIIGTEIGVGILGALLIPQLLSKNQR